MQSDLNFRNLCMKDRLKKERVKKEEKKMTLSASRGYDTKDLNCLITRESAARKKIFNKSCTRVRIGFTKKIVPV